MCIVFLKQTLTSDGAKENIRLDTGVYIVITVRH